MPGSGAQFKIEQTNAHGRADNHARFGPLSPQQLEQVNRVIRDGGSQAELIALIAHDFNRLPEMTVADFLGVSLARFLDTLRSARHRIDRVADRKRHDRQLAQADRQATKRYPCSDCGHTSNLGPRDGKFCNHCGAPVGSAAKGSR